MGCNGNYPLGAQYDPAAPWNEPEDNLTEEGEFLDSEDDDWLEEMKELRPESKLAYGILRICTERDTGIELPNYPDKDCLDALQSYPVVGEGDSCPYRYWTSIQKIYKVKDFYIRATVALTSGDTSLKDAGWNFDPNSMAVVYPVEKTITVYKTRAEIDNNETD